MPKKKPSALEALVQHDEERRAFEDRGAEIRRAAALEIGSAVLDAGGGVLTSKELTAAIEAAGARPRRFGPDLSPRTIRNPRLRPRHAGSETITGREKDHG